MGKPYSDDLRERVVAAIEAGHTRVKVASFCRLGKWVGYPKRLGPQEAQ
jgi:hypothetical protein